MYSDEMTTREDNPFVEKFEEFFKHRYMKQIEALISEYPQKRSLSVDFNDIEHYDVDLADELLVNSDVCLTAAHQAIKNIDVPLLEIEEFAPHIRIFNLPKEKQPVLRDVSSAHIGKLITVEGVIRQVTDVLPKIKFATWKCSRCDATYKIPQKKNITNTPSMCSECKNRTFNLDEENSEFEDYQKIQIQEPLEILKGSEQATNLDIYISDDFVNMVAPGDRTKITGILRLMPPKEKKVVYGRYLEALHLEETEKEFEDVEIDSEEEKEIKELAKRDDVYDLLVQSIAPHIYGHETMKESIALQMFGGVKKTLPGDQKIRGNIHVLIVGDPGLAKSAILRATDSIAPKSIYVAGKTTSGAGITATAVKDEFGDGGWTLKAGALVLASGGMAMVDEFDKMDPNDRSAMHEALEQQSYHKDFEIMLADGSIHKIGNLVDELIKENQEKMVLGTDCEILDVKNLELMTSDFNKVFPIKATSVSRHKAPQQFIEIIYSNGRKITVTPEHPVFVFSENGFDELPAEKVKKEMFVPGVKNYSVKKSEVELVTEVRKGRKELLLPAQMNQNVGRLLGYVASEGHSYINAKNRYAEIGICNTDKETLKDMEKCFSNSFSGKLNKNLAKASSREKATKDLTTIRCSSHSLYSYFEKNFSEILPKAPQKRAPNKLKESSLPIIKNFIQSAFTGDGFIDSERFGLSTSSYDLACDYQDLLLQIGIYSYIATEKNKTCKVVVSGTENMEKFMDLIPKSDKRIPRIKKFIKRSNNRESSRNLIPNPIIKETNSILKELHLSKGYFVGHIKKTQNAESNTIKKYIKKAEEKLKQAEKKSTSNNPRTIRKAICISLESISQKMKLSTSMITYLERNPKSKNSEKLLKTIKLMAKEKTFTLNTKINKINELLDSQIKFLKIEKVKKIENTDSDWVYDVTVEPTQCFVSKGLILHNSISIAKAGIVTKFKTDTSVLAAANPKYSRFDPYQPFIDQVNLPPTLLSRFDLFFMMRDVLDRTKDLEIAGHILKSHKAGEMIIQRSKKGITKKDKLLEELTQIITPKINGDLLKKYISYARQKVFPVLSDDGMQKLSDFYISLRDQGRKEGSYAATHRQLEGLIRLAEASARVRLSDFVEEQDVERSVRLVRTSLEDLVTDPETGKIDIDIITSGQTHTQLANLKKVLGIIKEKAQELDIVPLEEVITEAKTLGMDADKVKEIISKLEKSGDVYKPKHGFVKPT
ncbi:MAG: LAGLIDADG family homing endonuclease [Candidatus Diapherotrites archaeon]